MTSETAPKAVICAAGRASVEAWETAAALVRGGACDHRLVMWSGGHWRARVARANTQRAQEWATHLERALVCKKVLEAALGKLGQHADGAAIAVEHVEEGLRQKGHQRKWHRRREQHEDEEHKGLHLLGGLEGGIGEGLHTQRGRSRKPQ